MAITTYSELQTAVANWLDRTDLTARAPEFIALAEAQMNRRLRVRQMVTRAEAALSSEFTDAPSDMLEPIQLALEISETDVRVLQYLAPERLLAEKSGGIGSGEPELYSVVGGSLRLLPAPSASYTGELTYYAKIPALASNATNWLLGACPDVYLYGALVQAAPYLVDDERVVTWGAMFQAALNDIQVANRVPGGKARTDMAQLIGHPAFSITTGA